MRGRRRGKERQREREDKVRETDHGFKGKDGKKGKKRSTRRIKIKGGSSGG